MHKISLLLQEAGKLPSVLTDKNSVNVNYLHSSWIKSCSYLWDPEWFRLSLSLKFCKEYFTKSTAYCKVRNLICDLLSEQDSRPYNIAQVATDYTIRYDTVD